MISGCDLAFSFIYTRNIDTLFILKVLEDVVRLFQGSVSFFDLEFKILLFIGKATCFARICGLHMRSAYAACLHRPLF